MAAPLHPTLGFDSPSRRRIGQATQLYVSALPAQDDLPDAPGESAGPALPASHLPRPPSGRVVQKTLREGQLDREAIGLEELPAEWIQEAQPPQPSVTVRSESLRPSVVVRPATPLPPVSLDTVVTRIQGDTEPAGRAVKARERPTAMDLPRQRRPRWPLAVGAALAVTALLGSIAWLLVMPEAPVQVVSPGADQPRQSRGVEDSVPRPARTAVPAPVAGPAPARQEAPAQQEVQARQEVPAPVEAVGPARVPVPHGKAERPEGLAKAFEAGAVPCVGTILFVAGTSADPVEPWLAVRASPSPSGALVGRLDDGRAVRALSKVKTWVQVQACGSGPRQEGWVNGRWLVASDGRVRPAGSGASGL